MNSTDMDKLGKIEKWSGNGTVIAKIKTNPPGLQKRLVKSGCPVRNAVGGSGKVFQRLRVENTAHC